MYIYVYIYVYLSIYIYVYMYLCHATETTAIQNTGKPLYIRHYSNKPSHPSVQNANSVTPNLPIVH